MSLVWAKWLATAVGVGVLACGASELVAVTDDTITVGHSANGSSRALECGDFLVVRLR